MRRSRYSPEFQERFRMSDLVDIAIPAAAQSAAEALGLKVTRSVTSGARVRQIPREDAEIAIECLRDWGFAARIVEEPHPGEGPSEGGLRSAA
jgi:hydrogenase maturation factor